MSTAAADPREGWDARLAGENSPVGVPLNSTSIAFENARIVKSGAATLYGLSGFSSRASSQFILVFDLEKIPAEGFVPMIVISTLTATANFSWDGGNWGRAFSRGIMICNSSTAATKTIGAADCWFDAQYT